MQMASVTGSGALDVTKLIDDGGLSRFQIAVVLLCGLVAILDGADTTSIAIAASTIAGLLNFPMSAFGVVFAAGTLGAMLGAMTFGPLADRFGRKRLLIVATVLFAIFTFLIAHANSYSTLVLYRFIAGLGLGGATPCFLALVSEYVPQRLRGTVVSVLWAAFPLGIMLGGFLNSYLVTAFGWQMIFYVGGVVPLVIAALLTLMLPESLQFLIGRSGDSSQAKRILARMAPEAVHRDAVLAIARVTLPGVPVKHLFSEGRALSTVALWIPFFAAFGVLAAVVFFTPALLRSAAGVAAAASNGALVNAFHGLGALLGMALAGRLIDRLGAKSVLGTALVLGAACTAALGPSVASIPLAAAATALVGFFVGIAGSGCIALAAIIYPPEIRATGIGWGMAMGRGGQVVAPLVAGQIIGATGDGSMMLLVMAAALIVSILFVFLLGQGQRPAQAGPDTRAAPDLIVS
jgi:AAHS family 4-hydroxybenzoate transporter-like MFS transporter